MTESLNYNFTCPHEGCNRKFEKKWSLTRHMRTHNGEKPFRCEICNKLFVEKCGLLRHEQTHSSNKVWKCNIGDCERQFKLKEYLDVHKKTFHGKIEYDLSDRNSNSFCENDIDTTVQLRERLVHMSLRHKEIELIHRKQIRDIQSQLQLSTNIIQEVFETLKSGGTESSYIINLCETYLRENHFVNNDSYVHVNPNYMSVHNGIMLYNYSMNENALDSPDDGSCNPNDNQEHAQHAHACALDGADDQSSKKRKVSHHFSHLPYGSSAVSGTSLAGPPNLKLMSGDHTRAYASASGVSPCLASSNRVHVGLGRKAQMEVSAALDSTSSSATASTNIGDVLAWIRNNPSVTSE